MDAVKQRVELYRTENELAADALGSRRRGHRERQRTRSAHQHEECGACKRRAWPENAGFSVDAVKRQSQRRRMDVPWAFSANPASMFLNSILP